MKQISIHPTEPILYAGDVHGRKGAVQSIDKAALKAGCKIVVQVGDFGILWDDPCEITGYFNKRSRKGVHVPAIGTVPPNECPVWYTCAGNHDNYDAFNQKWEEAGQTDTYELAPGCFAVRRGGVIELGGQNHLFFGGALSIDKHFRIEGKSWWAEEMPTKAEFDRFFDSLNDFYPTVVVTHEAPARVNPISHHYDEHWKNEAVPKNLETALKHSEWSPDLWFFGHHHMMKEWQIDGTKFVCCGLNGQHHIWETEEDA